MEAPEGRGGGRRDLHRAQPPGRGAHQVQSEGGDARQGRGEGVEAAGGVRRHAPAVPEAGQGEDAAEVRSGQIHGGTER